MKKIFDFDTCMITLGLATLVVQWRWEDTGALERGKKQEQFKIAAVTPTRTIRTGADTATVIGYHQQVYARVLKEMGEKSTALVQVAQK